jgi:hypothetical protein
MAGHRRRIVPKAAAIAAGCGLLAFLACLGVNALIGPPFLWGWMIGIGLFVALMMAGFLWIRLTPDA